MNALPFLCAGATLGLLGLHLLAETRSLPLWRAAAKVGASLGFVGLALSLGVDTPSDRLLLAALLLSLLGDALLISGAKPMFLAGLGAFLLAHVAYAAAFLGRAALPLWPLPPLAVGVWLTLRWLWPHLGSMKGAVVAYCAVIAVMVAAAMGVSSGAVRVGAVLFFLSDLLVARDRFVAPGFGNRLVGLPLYYAAQLLLASAVG